MTTIERNSNGLREHLFNTLERFADRKIRVDEAQEVGKLAKQINNTFSIDFKNRQLDHKIKMDAQNIK